MRLVGPPKGDLSQIRLARTQSDNVNVDIARSINALAGRLLLVRNDREAACYELPLESGAGG